MTSRISARIVSLALVVAIGLAASWLVGSAMLQPSRHPVSPAIMPARDVTLLANDGLKVAGTYWPGVVGNSPAVLLLHGHGASREMVFPNAKWLAKLGYAVLAIDFRGHGESAMAPYSFGLHEARDAAAAFSWLKDRQKSAPVAVVGISLGGASTLIGRRGPLPADALVLQAVYPDIRRAIRNRISAVAGRPAGRLLEPLLSFQSRPRLGVWPDQLSPINALQRYHGPILIVGGKEDRYTPPVETRQLYAAAGGKKGIWLADEGDHAAVCALKTEAYRRKLLAFLGGTIGRPSESLPRVDG